MKRYLGLLALPVVALLGAVANGCKWAIAQTEEYVRAAEGDFVLYALIKTSDVASGAQPMPVPAGSELYAVRLEIDLTVAPVANDTAYLGDIPEDCVPVDGILDAPDLDTNGAPAITISVGTLNAAKTDLVDTFIAASTIGQAGGMARPTLSTLARLGASAARRPIGLKFPAAAATFAAGKVGFTLFYRAAHFGK